MATGRHVFAISYNIARLILSLAFINMKTHARCKSRSEKDIYLYTIDRKIVSLGLFVHAYLCSLLRLKISILSYLLFKYFRDVTDGSFGILYKVLHKNSTSVTICGTTKMHLLFYYINICYINIHGEK